MRACGAGLGAPSCVGSRGRQSAGRLAADLRARGVEAVACNGVDAIVDDLLAAARPGDVVVTLSNGGFGGIWDKLLDGLRKA